MGYSREEQETTMVFCNETKLWSVYTTVPKHIRKLTKITDVLTLETEEGRPLAIKCTLTEKQVSMKAERNMSEEQREAAAERLKIAREKGNE